MIGKKQEIILASLQLILVIVQSKSLINNIKNKSNAIT